MATWNKNKVNASDVNNGNQFNPGDGVRSTDINKIFESGLYSQDVVEHISIGKVTTAESGEDASANITYNDYTNYPEINLVLPRGPAGGLQSDEVYNFVEDEYEKTLNLIDSSKITYGYGFVDNSAELESVDGWFVTDFCEVEPSTKYAYFDISSWNTRIFDENKNLIEIQVDGDYVNVPSNGRYVRFNSKIEGYTNPGLYKFNSEESYGDIIHKKDLGTLLWENGNPSTTFNPQTIGLDLTPYKSVLVIFKDWYDATSYSRAECNIGYGINVIGNPSAYNGKLTIDFRRFTVTTGGVNFENNYRFLSNGEETITNGDIVPFQIYGIK